MKGHSTLKQFKIGDKVRISNINCPGLLGEGYKEGEVCTIQEIGDEKSYLAEFKDGGEWWIGGGADSWYYCDVELVEEEAKSALDVQVGGSHYKDMKIQPVQYILANELPFVEGSIIKYVSRWRNKNGVADLEKARHFLDILIEEEKKSPLNLERSED